MGMQDSISAEDSNVLRYTIVNKDRSGENETVPWKVFANGAVDIPRHSITAIVVGRCAGEAALGVWSCLVRVLDAEAEFVFEGREEQSSYGRANIQGILETLKLMADFKDYPIYFLVEKRAIHRCFRPEVMEGFLKRDYDNIDDADMGCEGLLRNLQKACKGKYVAFVNTDKENGASVNYLN